MKTGAGGRPAAAAFESVSSAEGCISLLNATAPSRGDLRGRSFIKRPLLSRPLHSVLEDQSDIHGQAWILTWLT